MQSAQRFSSTADALDYKPYGSLPLDLIWTLREGPEEARKLHNEAIAIGFQYELCHDFYRKPIGANDD